MKGFVLHFGNKNKGIFFTRIKEFRNKLCCGLKSRGISALLLCSFFIGMTAGAALAGGFDKETLNKLDILFISNISARQDMSSFDIAVSCFVSCFLFIFSAFIASLSVWGAFFLPMISAFNGFTVGVSAAAVIIKNQLPGLGFFIVVILPGAALFLYDLIRYSTNGVKLSLQYVRLSLYGSAAADELKENIRLFIRKTIFAFLLSGVCAVLDMLLWSIFVDKFDF